MLVFETKNRTELHVNYQPGSRGSLEGETKGCRNPEPAAHVLPRLPEHILNFRDFLALVCSKLLCPEGYVCKKHTLDQNLRYYLGKKQHLGAVMVCDKCQKKLATVSYCVSQLEGGCTAASGHAGSLPSSSRRWQRQISGRMELTIQ